MSQQLEKELAELNLWISPETIQKIWAGEIKITYKAYKQLDEFVTGARKIFQG